MAKSSQPHILVSMPIILASGEPLPASVELRSCSLPFHGQPATGMEAYFWGLQGNNARASVLHALSNALPAGSRVIRVDVEYRVAEYTRARAYRADFEKGTVDCLHSDRAAPLFSNELRDNWVEALLTMPAARRRFSEREIREFSIDDITCYFPEMAMRLFEEFPAVSVVSFMVNPIIPGQDAQSIDKQSLRARIAVCRADESRIVSAGARFLPEIQIYL